MYSRGAESWWGCSDSGSDTDSEPLIDSDSDSGSDSDSDSGFYAEYEITLYIIVEKVCAIQPKKTRHFILTSAFIPSDRPLSQLSLILDQLNGVGNGVMAVSRTFAWWGTCALRAKC